MISLEDAFPEAPLLPNLAYAAFQQLPISLPYHGEPVTLGTGVSIPKAEPPVFHHTKAFSATSIGRNMPMFYKDSEGSYVESTATLQANFYDQMGLDLGASIGGSALGVSGRGTIKTDILSDRDVRCVKSLLGINVR